VGRAIQADLYAALEVAPHARPAIIEAAFTVLREVACRDNSPKGTRLLVQINRAHHVLSDPDRRRAYDASRSAEESQAQ
jgi:curved DNA-binding protein CbpA